MQKLILTCTIVLFAVLFTSAQNEKLEVEGAIVIENNDAINPVAGTIRWTGTDFEGFDGTKKEAPKAVVKAID